MKKNHLMLIIAIVLLGIIIQGLSFYDALVERTVTIERPSAEDEDRDVRLEVSGAGQKSQIDISVIPQKMGEDQIEKLFDQAISEIDESFFGDNESPDAVWRRLKPRTSYAGDMVGAQWDFSPGGIVDPSGDIDHTGFEEDEIITADCTLSIEDEKRDYTFYFTVVQPDVKSPEGFLEAVRMLVERSNEDNAGTEMVLPGDISGQKLLWKKPVEYKGLILCVLGLVTGVALYLGSGIDEKREMVKKREVYGRQYPDIVENLSLYVGAGISPRGAFDRMEKQYMKWKGAHPKEEKCAYENLILMNRAIRDGALEGDAYDRYGRNCIHPSYRKLTVLLRQNLRHGNERLLEQLSHEEQMVREARLRDIKTAGEQVSTKLLIPMGGLLGMILIVLIVPALMSISL
ncbi:MAG: hypothetical protein K6B14_00405 [Lachnospiraceae bacterium]|nr:hypothetical protein [Lachnospiraceae bacterium]